MEKKKFKFTTSKLTGLVFFMLWFGVGISVTEDPEGAHIIMFLLFLPLAVYFWFFADRRKSKGVESALANVGFNVDRKVTLGQLTPFKYFFVDGNAKKFAYYDKKNGLKVFTFDKLVDFDVYQDGDSIAKGSFGSALAGGLAFGGLGAIAGAKTGTKKSSQVCNDFSVRLKINDLAVPLLTYSLLDVNTKKSSPTYKNAVQQAEELLATLEWINNNR